MEILLGLVILAILWSILALVVWQSVKFVAKLNGHDKNSMPLHYHFIGVGAYFTLFWVSLYIMHVSVT